MKLTLEQGRELVEYARKVIEGHYSNKKLDVPDNLWEAFKEELGVFVTLHSHPGRRLRGCIGFPEPVMPFGDAVRQAALAAALADPRFPPVDEPETKKLVVEVSLLTKPELIRVKDAREYPEKVEVGVDGLIVEKGYSRGLLLPQVAVEHGWSSQEFLSETCMKAGLNPNAWLVPGTKVHKFSTQIFSEERPGGRVAEKKPTA